MTLMKSSKDLRSIAKISCIGWCANDSKLKLELFPSFYFLQGQDSDARSAICVSQGLQFLLPGLSYKNTLIIDVRSPAEFLIDRIPQAINAPVLTDNERAEVGTQYKQNKFQAKLNGAKMISANIARILERHATEFQPSMTYLVYCWRGGQRSQSLAHVMTQIGYRVTTLEGGYKAYRATVAQRLELLSAFRYIVIGGLTGTGKGRVLSELKKKGAQVVDLEELAVHRGSAFGEILGKEQPSQRLFESRLLYEMRDFSSALPVFVESESSRVGTLSIPPAMWTRMKSAQRVELQLPLAQRVESLHQQYKFWQDHPELVLEKLKCFTALVGKAKVKQWNGFVRENRWLDLISDLLISHYDFAYRRSLRANRSDNTQNEILPLVLQNCTEEDYKKAAEEILRLHVDMEKV